MQIIVTLSNSMQKQKQAKKHMGFRDEWGEEQTALAVMRKPRILFHAT